MLVSKLIGKYNEYNEKVAESNKQYAKTKLEVGKIEADYNSTDNNEKKKVELEKLMSKYKEMGIDIPVRLRFVSEQDMDKEFKNAVENLEEVTKAKKDFDIAMADNNKAFIADGFDTDTKEYIEAYETVISTTKKVDDGFLRLYASYDSLNQKQKEMLDSVKEKGKDESEIEYLERKSKAVQNVAIDLMRINESSEVTTALETQVYRSLTTGWTNSRNALADYHSNVKEVSHEVTEVINDMKERMTNEEWNRTGKEHAIAFVKGYMLELGASEEQINEVLKNLGIKVKVKVDKSEVKHDVDWVKKEITDSLDGTKIRINLSVNENFLGGLYEQLDAAQERIKKRAKFDSLISGNRTGKIYWGSLKNDADFVKWYTEWRGIKSSIIKDTMEVSDFTIKEYLKAGNESDTALLKAYNQQIDAENKHSKDRVNNARREERDIWSERISVLKEMQSKYEKARNYFGESGARAITLSEYLDALKHVKIGEVISPEDIVPTKQGLVYALDKVLASMPTTIKDYAKKSGELKKTIGELKLEIQTGEAEKSIERVKSKIDGMFDGLELYNKMKKEGFTDDMVKSLFGDITTTEGEIKSEIEKISKKEGRLWEKAYKDLSDKLKAKQDEMLKSRIEAYSQFLNDFENEILNKQRDLESNMNIAQDILNKTGDIKSFSDQVGNVLKKHNADVAKIEIEKFKESGTYIEMMGDLSMKSAKDLEALIKRLETFISMSSSKIPANEMKVYIDRLKEVNEELGKAKSPFDEFFTNKLKEIIKTEKEYNDELQRNKDLRERLDKLNLDLKVEQSNYNLAKENGLDTSKYEANIVAIKQNAQETQTMLGNSDSILSSLSSNMGAITNGAGKTLAVIDTIVKGVHQSITGTIDLFNEVKSLATSFGVNTDSAGWQDFSMAMGIIGDTSKNVMA